MQLLSLPDKVLVMKKRQLTFRIESELFEKLREEAEKEDVGISTIVRRIIKLYFARRGE